ncbi:Glycerol-3-phosphate dehydrogenase, anaerobic, B subunit [Desulfosarcina cetonica]|nr:Glycerol-3-phosphate dehydrogenase, anaerobic, B subunit [Desulfosarcina cetonica]
MNMPDKPPDKHPQACQLMIVGAGMAGCAAALFAAREGISTIQVGLTGETLFASGLFDLYGATHETPRTLVDKPWPAIQRLKATCPAHPYSRVTIARIRSAMDQMTDFLAEAGQPYRGHENHNVRLITSVGSIKRTYRVPVTMWAGVRALETKAPCLVIDVVGLRGFSATQIVETLKPAWPALTGASIELSGENRLGPKYAEHIAHGLAVAEARRELAEAIRPHLGTCEVVGLPAILGIHDPEAVLRDLEAMLGRPVFEIPTMPPSIAGVRLKEAFDIHLPRLGVDTRFQHRALSAERLADGRFSLQIGKLESEGTVVADHLLLATGRFLGKGLTAERQGIRESLLHLPVVQPEHRGAWHRETFLAPEGHAINLAGLAVDDQFRPLDSNGRPVYGNLYAAGSILAHQDWMRTKSGTGLAVATALGAVDALKQALPFTTRRKE